MVSLTFASEQIARLSGLDFFPRDGEAARELVNALMVAESDFVAKKVIDEWIHFESVAPKPAALRKLVYEKQASSPAPSGKCQKCDGGGFQVIWYLATYRGSSDALARAEPLAESHQSYEAAQEFARFLEANPTTERQTVISAAKRCGCNPVGEQHAR